MKAATGLALDAVSDRRGATGDADIIVTCTSAEAPFLGSREVPAGAFVAAIGADVPHKSEIKPELMAKASVFVDVPRNAWRWAICAMRSRRSGR